MSLLIYYFILLSLKVFFIATRTGTYKIALHKMHVNSLHSQVNKMGRRFSILPADNTINPGSDVQTANLRRPSSIDDMVN